MGSTTRPEPLAYIALLITLVVSVDPSQLLVWIFSYAFRFFLLYALLFLAKPEVDLFLLRMEPKAAELLEVLKNNNLSIDTKVAHILGIKSDIKQKNVPEGAVSTIFECLRLAIASHHASVLAAGFSTLGHFLKRLFIQEQHGLISQNACDMYPILLEKLGDHKERVRAYAAQTFTNVWPANKADVEHYVLDLALKGRNPKAKEMSLIWLSNMANNHNLLFKSYVPSVVACLEDADGSVRDTAKITVVELFQEKSPSAKENLKAQMAAFNVRKSIASVILASLGIDDDRVEHVQRPASRVGGQPSRPPSRGDALHQRPASRIDARPARPPSRGDALHNRPSRPPSRGDALHHRPATVMFAPAQERTEAPKQSGLTVARPVPVRPHLGASKSDQNKAPRAAATSPSRVSSPQASPVRNSVPTTPRHKREEGDKVEPRTVASARDFENIVRDMLPCFEGRESESNWMQREKNTNMLRRLTHGNAPEAYPQAFLAAIKSLLDGIFKVALSLRTTLATCGCLLVQDVAMVCGPKIDPMVEIIMQNLVKLCAGTKKITAHNGNVAVVIVLENVTYTPRILYHITAASQEKNAQLRLYAAGWIKTIINKQAGHKSSIEHGGGLESIEKCIRKSLSDANVGVREAIRSTFWAFYLVWPDRASHILSDLDAKTRSLLEKDSSNPGIDPFASNSTSSKTGLNSSTSAGRSALKEAIAAGKKAYHAPGNSLHPFPQAAQSALLGASSNNQHPKQSTASTHISSLTSAPMRPALSKPRPPPLDLVRSTTSTSFPSRPSLSPSRIPLLSPTRPRRESVPPSPSKIQSTPLTTRPRQKSDPLQDASPTKLQPRKIDFSQFRVKAPSHLRNKSHDSNASQPLDENKSPLMLSASNPFELQVPRDLENPWLGETSMTMAKPEDHAMENHPPASAGTSTSDHQSTPINDQSTGIHSHSSPMEPNKPVDDPIPTSGNTSKQPEPVRIYEDPVAPVQNQQGTHPYHVPEALESPQKNTDDNLNDTPTLPKQSAQEDLHVEQVAGPVKIASQIPANDPPPSQHSQSEPPYGTDSPSAPYGTIIIPKSRSKNKENTAPTARKVSVSVGARRISRKCAVLQEISRDERVLLVNNTPIDLIETELPPGTSPIKPQVPIPKIERPRQVSNRWKRDVTPKRRDISPRSQDPKQAALMLAKGITRIQTNNMDILGYRRIQGLIEYHDTLFEDEDQFDEMILALIQELQGPLDDNIELLDRSADLKTQALVTLRYMLEHAKKYFVGYYPQAAVALLRAHKHYDPVSHIVAGIEETLYDIIAASEFPDTVIEAVVEMLETEVEDDIRYKSFQKGVEVLTNMLADLHKYKYPIEEYLLERIGEVAAQAMEYSDVDVKRKVVALCVELRSMTNSVEHFWTVLGNPQDNVRNLIVYYNARLVSAGHKSMLFTEKQA